MDVITEIEVITVNQVSIESEVSIEGDVFSQVTSLNWLNRGIDKIDTFFTLK
jgi:hypothetical protein